MQTNIIHNKSCVNMDDVDSNSVGLIVSSPPYYNLRDYSNWDSYSDYLSFIKNVLAECYRVLKPGGWICWNIQEGIPFPPGFDEGKRKTKERYCEPLLAQTIMHMNDIGFLYEKDVIWNKGKGTATQKLIGSWPLPSIILLSGITEHIIVARKPRGDYKFDVADDIREKSKISKEDWGKWAVDHWDIHPARSTWHSAPFPHEIPKRCITLFSFYDDIVLDPFSGSGTTAMVARDMGRRYVGYELNSEYAEKSNTSLKATKSLFE